MRWGCVALNVIRQIWQRGNGGVHREGEQSRNSAQMLFSGLPGESRRFYSTCLENRLQSSLRSPGWAEGDVERGQGDEKEKDRKKKQAQENDKRDRKEQKEEDDEKSSQGSMDG